MTKKILLTVAAAVMLVRCGAPAAAALCARCKGQSYILTVGKCVECGGAASSGAFKLCGRCSRQLGQCEHCRAALAMAAPRPRPEADEPPARKPAARVWTGRFRSDALRKHAPACGFVDNEAGWKKLWSAWRRGAAPAVDFAKELVVVATVPGPNRVRLMTRLERGGNLRVLAASTRMGGPGFGYGMQVVARQGVQRINGKPLPAAGGDAPAELALAAGDSGKTKSAVIGQRIVISLGGNPTTGYSWAPAGIEGDAVRQVGKIEYAQRPTARPVIGAGGTFTATFQAVKVGKATVRLAYRRPWEKDKPPAETFSVTVEVAAKPAAAQAVTVRLETPSTAWRVRIQSVHQVGQEVWVVSKLAGGGIGGAAITTVQDTVRIPPTKLPIRHFVLGKTWGWGQSSDKLTYVKDEAELTRKLAGGRKIEHTR